MIIPFRQQRRGAITKYSEVQRAAEWVPREEGATDHRRRQPPPLFSYFNLAVHLAQQVRQQKVVVPVAVASHPHL